jgi:hypothetical protein
LAITTNLVVELVRAANDVGELGPPERRHLLRKGVTASEALREFLIKTGKVAPLDRSAELVIKGFASNKEAMTDETVAKALLTLADQIRTMRIVNR